MTKQEYLAMAARFDAEMKWRRDSRAALALAMAAFNLVSLMASGAR